MRFLAAAASLAAFSAAMADPAAIELVNPIDCTLGADCFIQQYADHDPGPDAQDYRCGGAAYDGHDGTDFRLPDKTAQAKGVAVRAAAPGVVKAIRDGEPDFDVGTFDKSKVKDIECGNGVVVDHADGWQTQYCHMRQGSIAVKPGDPVEAGATLGLVGQSGNAAFIHLHLTVRQNGTALDPFAPGASACNAADDGAASLWRADDRAALAYRGPQVINAGFAPGPVDDDAIERGGIPAPLAGSPALVFYARAINLKAGDVQALKLTAPDGTVLAESTLPPVDRNKAQFHAFAGKKLTVTAWPAGAYRGDYTVTRGAEVIVSHSAELTLE